MKASYAVSAAAVVVLACGGDSDTGGRWAGTVDTLENGVVLVSNPATGIWDSTTSWRLIEETRIGSVDGDGPDVFSVVIGLEADELDRIYVLDRQIQEVRVFEENGSYVRTLGRAGEGPGEFRGADGLGWGPQGRLWVVDHDGAAWVITGAESRHVRRLTANPQVELDRHGETRCYVATPIRASHTVDDIFRRRTEKYFMQRVPMAIGRATGLARFLLAEGESIRDAGAGDRGSENGDDSRRTGARASRGRGKGCCAGRGGRAA